MRVPTGAYYQQSTNLLNRLQNELTQTQLQIASGRRILTPSDDPVASAQLSNIESALSQNTQFQRNANLATSRLSVEETSLTDVQNAMFRMRDLMIQANNDTQTNESRRFIAVEAREIHDQLVELGNRRDGQNNYIFSGFQSRTEPFSSVNDSVQYNGDQGERRLQIGPSRYVTDGDSGGSVFMDVPNGNGQFVADADLGNTGSGVIGEGSLNGVSAWDGSTYAIVFTAADQYDVVDEGGAIVSTSSFEAGDTVTLPGATVTIDGTPAAGDEFSVSPSTTQDVFSLVRDFADALENPGSNPASNARLHNDINRSLTDIDQSIGNVLDIRSSIGSRMQAIETQEDSNADFDLTLQTTRSELQDVDYAEAISRLNLQLTSLEAAQQTFARIQGLSLFDVI